MSQPDADSHDVPPADPMAFSVWQTVAAGSAGSGDQKVKLLARYVRQFTEEPAPADSDPDPAVGSATARVERLGSEPVALPPPVRPPARLARTKPLAPGYRILRHLGDGTYGSVWLAQEDRTGVRVAIKFFAHGTGKQWEKLQDDMQMLARTDGAPGVVQLKAADPDNDPPYYVMSYAEGGSLADLLERGPVPAAEALRLFRRITDALAYVHAKGIRHCDLKPGNILLDARGEPLIADFGQAHLADDARPTLGTYFYMAPEQADLREHVADSRWDVYGLGAVLYEMLTRDLPRFEGTLVDRLRRTNSLVNRLSLYREQLENAPRPTRHRQVPGVDRYLADIVERCLEVEPERRYRDAGSVLAALDRRDALRRRRSVAVFGVGITALLAGLTAWVGSSVAANTLDLARTQVTEQVLSGNRAAAQLAARGMERILRERIETVETFARTDGEFLNRFPAIQRKMAQAHKAGRHPVDALDAADRDYLNAWAERKYNREGGKGFYASGLAVVAHVEGRAYILARLNGQGRPDPYDADPKYFHRNWAWRSWFNGDADLPDPDHHAAPIRSTHISQPYKSQAAGGSMLVTMSTPVRSPDDPEIVIGLIISGIELTGFCEWIDAPFGDKKGDNGLRASFPTVVSDRGHVLKHDSVTAVESLSDAAFLKSRDDWKAARDGGPRQPDYADPLTPGKAYLAGVEALRPFADDLDDRRWLVVVQTDREAALKSIDGLKASLARIGWATLAMLGALLGGVWLWLYRLMGRAAEKS